MTTRPNRFVTWSSSSSRSVIRSFVRRLERPGERDLGHQRIVDDLHRPAVLGVRLPLHADAGRVHDTRRGFLLEVQLSWPARPSMFTLNRAAATSLLSCGLFTEVSAA